jgi:hypothetical protein
LPLYVNLSISAADPSREQQIAVYNNVMKGLQDWQVKDHQMINECSTTKKG